MILALTSFAACAGVCVACTLADLPASFPAIAGVFFLYGAIVLFAPRSWRTRGAARWRGWKNQPSAVEKPEFQS